MSAPAGVHRGTRVLADLAARPSASPALPRERKRKINDATLREMFASGRTDQELADAFGCCLGLLRSRRRALGLRRRAGRPPGCERSEPASSGVVRKARSRHEPKTIEGRSASMPPVDHPALASSRTIYPGTVVEPLGQLNLLIAGENSWKVGPRIVKGRWRGFPVYTLTLEERATCPTSCAHWRSCTGNHMNWAKRFAHGPALEERLGFEVGLLAYRHPGGFAVRLHVLGDFYSAGYVELWRRLIERFPALHVFGFSARIDPDDEIAIALKSVMADHWPRFGIRLSNAPMTFCSTISIEHPVQKPRDAIVCPQQTGRTASCSTCALCWSIDRRIAFLRH